MKDGILLIDKPAGLTSAQAIAAVRRRLKLEKIGHAGTLDPMATGLLVVLVNSATRLASYAEAGDKVYSGIFRFGLATDSDDITGNVLERSEKLPAFAQVRAAADSFLGTSAQVPPRVSAIKVDGERAYRRVRRGETVALKSRMVTVRRLELEELAPGRVWFNLHCSKGTYVRSLARDLGEKVGCPACLASLRREASLPFSVKEAAGIEAISLDHLRDWRELFPKMPRLLLDEQEKLRWQHGDTSLLGVLGRRLCGAGAGSPERAVVALCEGAEGRFPLGLLVLEQGRWRYGVNLAGVPG